MKRYIMNTHTLYSCALLTVAALAGVASSVHAQTTPADSLLNRTVVVEQQYNPDIMDAQKINVVPRVEELTVSPKTVEYDNKIAPAASVAGEQMDAYAGKEKQADIFRNYVRFGYGSYGNVDARANFLFMPSDNGKLNVLFGMDGRDGKLKNVDADGKWNSHYYRTRAGINYLHQFGKTDMDIAGNFGLSNFNNNPLVISRQKRFTSGDVRIGFVSTDKDLPFQFNVGTNLLLYSREHNAIENDALEETIIRTKADFTGVISEEHGIGLALEMNNRFYGYDKYDDYTSLLLNPYYTYQTGNWKIRLGVNVDLAFSFGDKFNVSPDVTANYIFSDSYILYANATGGRIMNDYRRMEVYNPHAELSTIQLEDSYEQINGMLGFKASPVTGFWLNLYGGYQKLENDLFSIVPVREMTAEINTQYYAFTNTSNAFGGMDMSYDYKGLFGITVSGKYQKWDADNELAYLLKPEASLKVSMDIKPVDDLHFNIGYQYAQRKKVSGRERLDPISHLNLNVSYRLFDGISVYARASNLLNSEYSYYLDYMEQGASILGGLSFKF